MDKIKGGLGFHSWLCHDAEPLPIPPRRTISIQIDRRKSSDWHIYRERVWLITNLVCHQIPGIEKRGFKDHHIDHIISIWRGFKQHLPAEQIGGLGNLRMLPYKDNMVKGRR